MGRSTPTHIRKECNLGEYGKDDASSDLDLTDEASIPLGAVVREDAPVDDMDLIDPPVTLGDLEEDCGGRVSPPPPPKLLDEDAIAF